VVAGKCALYCGRQLTRLHAGITFEGLELRGRLVRPTRGTKSPLANITAGTNSFMVEQPERWGLWMRAKR
jgi:hypothetical protein